MARRGTRSDTGGSVYSHNTYNTHHTHRTSATAMSFQFSQMSRRASVSTSPATMRINSSLAAGGTAEKAAVIFRKHDVDQVRVGGWVLDLGVNPNPKTTRILTTRILTAAAPDGTARASYCSAIGGMTPPCAAWCGQNPDGRLGDGLGMHPCIQALIASSHTRSK
eukprot:358821-Chlamydomonas_euryale.AAC.1